MFFLYNNISIKRVATKRVSFGIRKGEFFGVLGVNGAGKQLHLKCSVENTLSLMVKHTCIIYIIFILILIK
jgi:ABC-type multidrug transport system ATPase subunit